jgi:hypothetical protein
MICRCRSTIGACKTDIPRLRKLIFPKADYFWKTFLFGGLGEQDDCSLTTETVLTESCAFGIDRLIHPGEFGTFKGKNIGILPQQIRILLLEESS